MLRIQSMRSSLPTWIRIMQGRVVLDGPRIQCGEMPSVCSDDNSSIQDYRIVGIEAGRYYYISLVTIIIVLRAFAVRKAHILGLEIVSDGAHDDFVSLVYRLEGRVIKGKTKY